MATSELSSPLAPATGPLSPSLFPILAAASAPETPKERRVIPAAATPTDALGAAGELRRRVTDKEGQAQDGAAAVSKQFFDVAAGGNGSGGDGAPPVAGGDGSGAVPLGRLFSRVIMILDTLDKPAEEGDRLVKHIETLLDSGVRVVFVTARPEKGANSAESMLVSKLKFRTGNPAIIVSYNGARAAAHNSRAENPKPLIEDQPPFADKTVARFREITETVKSKLGVRGKIGEYGLPSLEAPYIYGGSLPEGVDAKKWTAAFNRALKSAGFKYKIETTSSDHGTVFFTQSTALKLNAGRIFNALYAAAPELDPSKGGKGVLKPSQVLIVADPAKAPSFLDALPVKGFYVVAANNTASLESTLESVLGGPTLETVAVNKYELREYIDWLARRQRYGNDSGGGKGSGKGGGGGRARSPNSSGWRLIAFYRGIIMKEAMSRIYHLLKNGQFEEATLDAGLAIVESLWRFPEANMMHLPEELKLGRQTAAFKAAQKGGLIAAKRWLKNYYHRHFPNFPRNVDEKVAGRLLRMARDGDSVTLNYQSPHTGRQYKVFVRPDRTELWEDEKGWILVGHVYRTGQEPYQNKFDESIEVNLVGRAMLEGDAKFDPRDKRWYVNGDPDPRVMVVFHYNTRDLDTGPLTPEQITAQTPEVTALIERRAADANYLKWREEKEKEQERARVNLKRTVTRESNLKAKAKDLAATKAKTSAKAKPQAAARRKHS